MAVTTRYTLAQVERFRALKADKRRHLYYAVPAVLLVGFVMLHANGWLIFCALAGAIVGFNIFTNPGSILVKYDHARTAWDALLMRSDPGTTLTVEFTVRGSETVYYAEKGERYEERRTGQVIDTQSRTKNAVGSAVVGGLLFGPAGAIVGGSMARRQTTGTATDVYNVVPVDHGHIAITSERFVFMGARDTVELPIERVMRYSTVEGTNRINVEYSGRKPGESYAVDPALFQLCMARRARDGRFAIPLPPPPLSNDVNSSIVLESAASLIPALTT